MADNLVTELSNLNEKEALSIVKARLDANEDPMGILADVRSAMEIVGGRFEKKEYFIPDLVYSGEILNEITAIVKPRMTGIAATQKLGKVIIGTVVGDIHDIGKNIVTFMLDTSGFEVYDLGVDIPPGVFADKITETRAPVVLLSGFLTLAFDSMKQTVDTIKEAGLRDKVKICIGGGQIDDNVRKYTGADGWGPDAMTAVSFSRKWIGGN
ncbi:MAG: cobalamin-dependent protein [Chloroflexota bacterium]